MASREIVRWAGPPLPKGLDTHSSLERARIWDAEAAEENIMMIEYVFLGSMTTAENHRKWRNVFLEYAAYDRRMGGDL